MEIEPRASGETNHDIENYRDLLRQEFRKRSESNPRYSLGAFARSLRLSPSRLHDVLNGRSGLSRTSAQQVAERLRFSERKTQYFCDLVETHHGRSLTQRRLARKRLEDFKNKSDFQKTSLDAFRAISDWYHFAILELTYLKGFRSDLSWVAKKLKVSKPDICEAIERLKRLGLLQEKEGRWETTEDFSGVGDDIPSAAIKKYHLQLLERAKKSLVEQPMEEREFMSLTMAMDRRRLPEAKTMVRDFQQRFCKTMGDSESKDSVYCLSLQLYNLTSEDQ